MDFFDLHDLHDSLMDFFDFNDFHYSPTDFYYFHDFCFCRLDFLDFHDLHDSHIVVRREKELGVRVPPPPSVEPLLSRGAKNTNG